MRNHGPDTVPRWCCLVCLAVLRRHWTQQVQKRRLLFARKHALHPWTLSLCVYACTRGSCVDNIWLWMRKETFSKPVFWGLKNKHFWLRGCGPSLCVCMLAVVVAVLITYDYECARKLSASLFLGSQKPSISGFVAVGPHCVCVYACSRSSCVDRIWLWLRKETLSK